MTAIHSHIEYHLLHPEVKDLAVEAAVREAIAHQLSGICVPPYWIKKASRDTNPAGIVLAAVVGFPFGYQRTEAKVSEAELAFADGAQEIILTINMSALKSERWNWIKAEIARFAKLVHDQEKPLTVLTDVDRLTSQEVVRLCKDAVDAGTDFFQTATGALAANEAPGHSVAFLRETLHPSVGLKVFRNQLTPAGAAGLLKEGADKICTSQLSDILVILPSEKS
jgi:deoxyribose-phosphate aldolase